MVRTIRLVTMVKGSVPNDIWLPNLLHLISKLLVHNSRHGLNNGPFDEQAVLDHLNTQLVSYSDPHYDALLCKMFAVLKTG